MLTASVVIPTYRRPEQLQRCLGGLRRQTRPPAEVIVVVQIGEADTSQYLDLLGETWLELSRAEVHERGLVAALNRGLAAASKDVVAFIDDDAVPEPDWLERIVNSYSVPEIAAVGGRDIIEDEHAWTAPSPPPEMRPARRSPAVGSIQWFGRMVGNHHIGTGGARDTDVLKGVNMSFRRAEVRHGFDPRLRGVGAQVHSEMSICLPLRRRGLRVVYDPQIVVHHHPARRPAGDRRADFDDDAITAFTHNETLELLDFLPSYRKPAFISWGIGIGTNASPGAAVLIWQAARRDPRAWRRFVAAQRGRLMALWTHATVRPTVIEALDAGDGVSKLRSDRIATFSGSSQEDDGLLLASATSGLGSQVSRAGVQPKN
jgi:hypothetical protein